MLDEDDDTLKVPEQLGLCRNRFAPPTVQDWMTSHAIAAFCAAACINLVDLIAVSVKWTSPRVQRSLCTLQSKDLSAN